MTTLRETAQQALEVLERAGEELRWQAIGQVQRDLRAALAQEQAERVQETDLSRCPQCNGPADNGHDRSIPPNPYLCTKCMEQPEPCPNCASLEVQNTELDRKLAEVEQEEREACAQIADAEASIEGIAQRISAAIRARSNK